MYYQCPKCRSPRENETREIDGKDLIVQVTYTAGCVLRVKRVGNVWKVLFEHCKTLGL